MQEAREAESNITSSKAIPLVSYVLVVNAKKIIISEYNKYGKRLEVYNKRLRLLTEDRFVVKPVHKSGGKEYHGRYFHERYWSASEKRIKQKYVGKAIPESAIKRKRGSKRLPEAPKYSLEGLECQLHGESVIMTSDMYEKFNEFFKGHFVVKVDGWLNK